jgi:ribonuclease PH
MSRPDFRNANQIRPPSCSVGDVTEANGSCHFSQGNTDAIASVVSKQLCEQLLYSLRMTAFTG